MHNTDKITRADFYDDIAWVCVNRASAYRYSVRVAKQNGCGARGLRTLREMMRGNAKEAVALVRKAKARAATRRLPAAA